jgi:hypothetical protein
MDEVKHEAVIRKLLGLFGFYAGTRPASLYALHAVDLPCGEEPIDHFVTS